MDHSEYCKVRLGEGASVDAGVVIGYLPARGERRLLTIGPGARLRRGSIIYGSSTIGRDLETGHNVVIREENFIGDGLRIWGNSVIDYGCRIGDGVKLHHNVYVSQFTVIDDGVFVGPGAVLTNDVHPGCPDAVECMQGPHLRAGAQVGANVSVLPRVTIGEHAVIGAGSVVTKDVPAGVVAVGSPARVIGRISEVACTTGLRDRPYDLIGRVEDAYTIS